MMGGKIKVKGYYIVEVDSTVRCMWSNIGKKIKNRLRIIHLQPVFYFVFIFRLIPQLVKIFR